MFKLTREKYIAAYESAKQLEDALRKENEKLQESSRNLSRKWWGSQAEQSLGNINESLETGNHAKALAYAAGMTSIMEEYLPGIEKMMAKREQLWKQLKQDEYAAPDLSCFYEDELIINYDYIEDIKADVEGALLYGDKAIQILEEMIEEAEEYAGEYVNLGSVKEMVEEGRKKLHRLENYRDEFVDFAKQMKDLEYNMSMDLSRVMRVQGDTTILRNPTVKTIANLVIRTEQIKGMETKQLKFMLAMEKNFGFDRRSAELLYKAYEGVQNECEDMSQEERDYAFLRLMGGFVYGGEEGGSVINEYNRYLWIATAGKTRYQILDVTEKEYFTKYLRFTEEEYTYLRYKLRIQHQAVSSPDSVTWDYAKDSSDYDLYKAKFEACTGQDFNKENWENQCKRMEGKGDFIHQMITMSALVSKSKFIIGEETSDITSGWFGDAVCGGGFGNDDYCSDLDAVNIVELMKTDLDFIDAANLYYDEVGEEYTRAEKFLENVPLEDIVDEIFNFYCSGMDVGVIEVKLEHIKELDPKAYNFLINLMEGNNEK